MFKIAVLVSGGGSNLQSLIDGVESGEIGAEISLVVADNREAYGLVRAENYGIKAIYIQRDQQDELLAELKTSDADLIVLAGYLGIITATIVAEFSGKIINIHPSLLPKYGGKGYYGSRVHEAVIAAGEAQSGATVHFVDSGIDTGKIIIQQAVDLSIDETPKTLAEKVLEVEHKILVKAVKQLADERSI